MSASLTAWALGRWTAALPAELYDVRLVPAGGGRATLRRFDAEALVRCTGWLRAMNAGGHHVYGRPLDGRHVLVDDLGAGSLATLQGRHRPAAVVESSPGCYQVWVTVSAERIEPPLATAAARRLARELGGDPGAASGGQVGRLPGFTNRKPLHERPDGTYPWARLRHAAAWVDPAGTALLAELALMTVPDYGMPAARGASERGLARASAQSEWREAAKRIASRLPAGASVDRSRVDAAVALRLLQRGADPRRALEVVLGGEKACDLSPEQAQRYATRTVAGAMRTMASTSCKSLLDIGFPPFWYR